MVKEHQEPTTNQFGAYRVCRAYNQENLFFFVSLTKSHERPKIGIYRPNFSDTFRFVTKNWLPSVLWERDARDSEPNRRAGSTKSIECKVFVMRAQLWNTVIAFEYFRAGTSDTPMSCDKVAKNKRYRMAQDSCWQNSPRSTCNTKSSLCIQYRRFEFYEFIYKLFYFAFSCRVTFFMHSNFSFHAVNHCSIRERYTATNNQIIKWLNSIEWTLTSNSNKICSVQISFHWFPLIAVILLSSIFYHSIIFIIYSVGFRAFQNWNYNRSICFDWKFSKSGQSATTNQYATFIPHRPATNKVLGLHKEEGKQQHTR